MIWFLNPLSIWVSSGWGMFDTLPALFTVISLYSLSERRYAVSGVALAIAVFLKYYAIVLLFPALVAASYLGAEKRHFASSCPPR
jgi:predicted membrane-bound dolichyl-phosphate-mannose-protein mannosyltransferase